MAPEGRIAAIAARFGNLGFSTKVLFAVLIPALLVCLSLGLYMTERVGRDASHRLDEKGRTVRNLLVKISAVPLLTYDYEVLDEYVKELLRDQEIVRAVILGRDGRPVTSGGGGPRELNPEDVRLFEGKIRHLEREIGRVEVAVSLAGYRQAVRDDLLFMAVMILLLVFGGLLVSLIISRAVTRPIRELAGAMEKAAGGDLTVRAEARSGDEIGFLALTFNQMLTQLQARDQTLADHRRHLEEEIQERRLVEVRLLEQQEFLDSVMNSLSHPFYVIDVNDYTIKLANPAARLGQQTEVSTCYALSHRADRPCNGVSHPCPVAEIRKNRVPVVVEHVHYDATGAPRYVEVHGYPIFDAGGEVIQVIEYNLDITERKRAETMIKKILETVDDGFVVIGRDYRILSANRAYCEQVGKAAAQVIGSRCHELAHALDHPCFADGLECPVRQSFATGQPARATHHHSWQAEEGLTRVVEVKAFPLRDEAGQVTSVIEITTDISEKVRLEEQLRQSQKMEAVGTMAGGVAHDFNNVLQAIMGYAELLGQRLEPDSPLRRYLEMIQTSSVRARDLTRAMLAFSRKQVSEPVALDLRELLVDGLGKILPRLLGEDIELEVRIAEGDFISLADRSQIEQALINIAGNARDAMPGGGLLTINLDRVHLDADDAKARGYGVPGTYNVIAIADNGIGMDQEVQAHLFEPFFTTKEVGKGTGLGMAIVYGIVKRHDGYVNCYSEKGVGTTIRVYLPQLQGETPGPSAVVAPLSPPRGGSETILLAEDNPEVRQMIVEVLSGAGYRVMVAENGEEAVALWQKNRGAIALLLFDVIMPKLNGRAAAEQIMAPGGEQIPLIFLSGYSENHIHRQGIIEPGINLIQKPVSPQDLLRKVRKVLDGERLKP
jgi:PAS domain S-box-containing protein